MANFITAEFGAGERYDIGIVKNRAELIERLKRWDMRVFGIHPVTKQPVKRAVFATGHTESGEYVQVWLDSKDQVFNDPPLCDEPPEECIRKVYTCIACQKNPVDPFDGEDTCDECLRNV